MAPSTRDVISLCATAAFGTPIIVNSMRGLVAEAIVRLALPDEWRWCSGDWQAYDFEHADGTRLEVKESAVMQSWKAGPGGYGKPRFDIATRKGRYDGAEWISGKGRNANLYVFALHPVADESADQRDPSQWQFSVVATARLPQSKTISLPRLQGLGRFVGFRELAELVDRTRLGLGAF
jgi:hypothetical protein